MQNQKESELLNMIEGADISLLEAVADAVICRYSVLYPDWDFTIFPFRRCERGAEQLVDAIRIAKSAGE